MKTKEMKCGGMFEFLVFVVGMIMLLVGAEWFTRGASEIARHLRVSEVVVGATIVAVGTSLPELAAGVIAVLSNASPIAVGDVIGSNILNIALVLGIAGIIRTMHIGRDHTRIDIPFLIISVLVTFLVAWDGVIYLWEGIILIITYIIYIASYGLYSQYSERGLTGLYHRLRELSIRSMDEASKLFYRSVIMFLIGMALVIFGADFAIKAAIDIANIFSVSQLFIGTFLVALGTSLPELAASTVAALKGRGGISIGNIFGSNMFNVLIVLGVLPFLGNILVSSVVITFLIPVMVALSFFLVALVFHKRIGKVEGIILVAAYALIFMSMLGHV